MPDWLSKSGTLRRKCERRSRRICGAPSTTVSCASRGGAGGSGSSGSPSGGAGRQDKQAASDPWDFQITYDEWMSTASGRRRAPKG